MKDLCIYHNDEDGVCSAAIVNLSVNDCDFYAINYGFNIPWNKIEKADRIFLLDFGLQPFNEQIKLLKMKGKKLIWIDHHKTALEDEIKSGQKFEGIREIGKAGCELTWEYFYPDTPMPKTVKMMGRYDVWDTYYHKDVMPFHYGMLMKGYTPTDNIWKNLFNGDSYYEELDYDNILKIGRICQDYQMMRYSQFCKPYHFITCFEGLKFICCNSMNSNSNLFDGFFDENKMDAMLAFGWTGNTWTVSMYSNKKGIDVGKIAKKYGGGGHANAAGFQCTDIPFPMKGLKVVDI